MHVQGTQTVVQCMGLRRIVVRKCRAQSFAKNNTSAESADSTPRTYMPSFPIDAVVGFKFVVCSLLLLYCITSLEMFLLHSPFLDHKQHMSHHTVSTYPSVSRNQIFTKLLNKFRYHIKYQVGHRLFLLRKTPEFAPKTKEGAMYFGDV